MKTIILASASPQRKKLFKLLGLPFLVKPSRVKEIKNHFYSCEALVKKNALLKARDIARKEKNSLVIGADTLVCVGNKKIIGKPKNVKEAKRTLKFLSRHPQWVYTGLAVVDSVTHKTFVDYEKTKVIMHPLSDDEINQYYRHVSPLDKAGGFDVQGRGAFLVKRIEGCYFNVVGLPVAKLYQMFKKMSIVVFLFISLALLGGCTTEYNLATQKEEALLYGTDKEVKIGESMAAEFDKKAKIVNDVDINDRVNNILQKIVAVCDRKELIYHIKVVDDDKDAVNAFSLPGGYVYIYKALVDKATNDDQLACVIGHEVGHIVAKHSVKKIQSLYGYTFLKVLTMQTVRNADFSQGVDVAFASIFTGYSREDEFLADKLGIKYAQKAGYNPKGMIEFFGILQKVQEKEPPGQFSYWRTHPYIPQRIAAANQAINGGLGFKDYINLIGEE